MTETLGLHYFNTQHTKASMRNGKWSCAECGEPLEDGYVAPSQGQRRKGYGRRQKRGT